VERLQIYIYIATALQNSHIFILGGGVALPFFAKMDDMKKIPEEFDGNNEEREFKRSVAKQVSF
jgi:hypothetical protein